MKMHTLKRSSSEAGAVSMITVLFVTMILAVLVIGFVRLMVSEQRQATDDDLSSRAFFAAESGIEDAKAALADYMMSGGVFDGDTLALAESCEPFGDPFLIADGGLETEITCQTVNPDLPDVLADSVPGWHSFLIPLRSGSNFDRFQLEWHRPEVDGMTFNLRNTSTLPTSAVWAANQHPAALKMTLLRRPSSGSINEQTMVESTRIVHMMPSGSGTNTFNTNASNFGLGGASSLPSVACQGGASIEVDDYACSATFTGLSPSSNDYYVMLTPLYRSTSIRLSLQNGGSSVNISNAQAEVDVTARAGDVFRRVSARILLVDPSLALIPDLAVGANEVCKNYGLRADPNEPGNDFQTVNPGVLSPSEYCVGYSGL